MPKTCKIISDITGKELKENNIINIYKSFGYFSDFDLGTLYIYTTKQELEELFGKKITKKTEVGNCFSCGKNIIEECRKNENKMGVFDLNTFLDYINERFLNISELNIDICSNCINKYFGKYVKYDG